MSVLMSFTPFSKRRLPFILASQLSQCICGVVVNTTVLMSLAAAIMATMKSSIEIIDFFIYLFFVGNACNNVATHFPRVVVLFFL